MLFYFSIKRRFNVYIFFNAFYLKKALNSVKTIPGCTDSCFSSAGHPDTQLLWLESITSSGYYVTVAHLVAIVLNV